MLAEMREGPLVAELARNVGQAPGELLPTVGLHLTAAELLRRLPRMLDELLVGHLRSRVAHDPERLRQQPLEEQVEEGRDQLPSGQVAGGPEDDHGGRVGRLELHPAILSPTALGR